MPPFVLPFEKPILDLQRKLEELREFGERNDIDVTGEVLVLENKVREMRAKIFSELTAWQQVQIARHPQRPYTRDYIQHAFTGFTELHGDRVHADDQAIVGGFAQLGSERVMVIGTQKGRDTKSNLACNFGCPFPEGYRKALRLMQLASKFDTPIVTLIDTPGAYPGIQSEERHIAEAIARNIREMFTFPVPMIVFVIGEGGSGGALGIGVGDRVLIFEHSYYSVISPEGCAAILWKDRKFSERAADALKLTAKDLLRFKMVDEIVPEPEAGAHSDHAGSAQRLSEAILRNLAEVKRMDPAERLRRRYEKFRDLGMYSEPAAAHAE
ncbi:MAG: acetyl-CoA carboxylase carboxyltransferase subunit alpha [Kiritimatiellae bacterium]|nr:acetyl-CoA carboxylase carboxyltransferase subunit alpha [Kiritimatiellia bacterium]